jgi:hypothetical protein
MTASKSRTYRGATLESRRRNCRTETTRTRLRQAILMRSRSRLRSSSLVTRYCALPWIAASRISSSSGSRQICSALTVSTTATRTAIRRIKFAVSECVYLNRRVNRGRISTSTSSVSCEDDVTALNWSRLQAATTCPGGPEGFRKAETHTLVSSRATIGTTCCFYLSAGLADFSFDVFLSYSARSSAHFAHKAFKVLTPFAFPTQGNGHTRFVFQMERPKRPKHAFFEDCLKSSLHRRFPLLRSHGGDYNGDPALGSIPASMEQRAARTQE